MENRNRRKQIRKAAVALLLSMALAFSAPSAYLFESIEVYAEEEPEFEIIGGVLVDYNGDGGNVVIPYGVTSIGGSAFCDCSSLTSISIPSSVTSIGESAFLGCSGLTSIKIPTSVTSIGNRAFSYCSSLTSIAVEEGNTSYDSRNNCNAIIESSSNTLIVGCKNTIIPSSVTSIGGSAFYGCRSLTSIELPSSVTSIGETAFSSCSGLMRIELPSSVTSIGWSAFSYCSCLTSIEISEGVPSIGESAFEGCSGLTSIDIPTSVKSIGDYAFESCGSLMGIEIPSSVTSIGESAFSGCCGLTSIVVKEGNTSYDSRNNCNAIIESSSNTLIAGCKNTVIPSSVTSIGESAFYECSDLTSIDIPSGVTSIGGWTFYNCSGLMSIEIPSSVTSIGRYAFLGCSSITSMAVEEGNTSYDSRNNCNAIIESSSNTLIAGCKNTIIPPSVMGIEGWAFSGCSSLTSIEIPSSVTSIGESAFSGCCGLTSIVVKEGNTSYDSRNNCNAIIESGSNTLIVGCSKTVIPDSVTSIGSEAFWGCSSLTSITISDSVTSIGYAAFYGCNKLTIYGEEGSYAQVYAKRNNIPFRLLGGQDIFAAEKLAELTEENKTQDTVIETSDGLTFTFKKGTMESVEGVDSYDFGAEIIEDYASLPNRAFTEDEFAFRINFYHSGQLPGEAQITIPADSKWAGQRLYYYEIKEDGTYSYVCRSTVAEDGSYTVKQNHCSSYVATTKVPENLGDCDGDGEYTANDALAILKHIVEIPQENFYPELADCDGQDGIASNDALAVLKYIAEITTEFE